MEVLVLGREIADSDFYESYKYGTLQLSRLDGRKAEIMVSSRYSWEEGVPQEIKVLRNPRFISGISGQKSVSILEADFVDEVPF